MTKAEDERYEMMKTMIRYLIAAVIASFGAVGGLYLYSAEKYVERDDYASMRRILATYSTKEDIALLRDQNSESHKQMRADINELRREMKADFERIYEKVAQRK